MLATHTSLRDTISTQYRSGSRANANPFIRPVQPRSARTPGQSCRGLHETCKYKMIAETKRTFVRLLLKLNTLRLDQNNNATVQHTPRRRGNCSSAQFSWCVCILAYLEIGTKCVDVWCIHRNMTKSATGNAFNFDFVVAVVVHVTVFVLRTVIVGELQRTAVVVPQKVMRFLRSGFRSELCGATSIKNTKGDHITLGSSGYVRRMNRHSTTYRVVARKYTLNFHCGKMNLSIN